MSHTALRALSPFAFGLGLAISITAAATPAAATVVVVPPLEEMVVACDVVGEVVVGDARVVREGGRVVTITSLEVKDGWKGPKTGDKLELWQLGGDLDGRSSWIVGQRRFHKGERLVFFGVTHKTRPSFVIPYGIGFGVFKIDEQLTGEKVIEDIGDVVTLEKVPGADGKVQTSNAPATRRYDTLAAFKELVLRASAGEELPKMNMNKAKLLPKQPMKPVNANGAPTPTPTEKVR